VAEGTQEAPQPDRDGSPTPGRVLLITPRWARDGGVGAHLLASAGALASGGSEVIVVAARIEAEPIAGVTLYHRPGLAKRELPIEARLGDALASDASVAHLHQIDDPEVVQALAPSTPVVISAHGYTACTSAVHYFGPGHECSRPHGPGCVPNLIRCAHSRNPTTLPSRYRHATRGLHALAGADLAISYSSAVDRHLAANGVTKRAIVPYFPTAPIAAADAQPRRVVFAGRVVPPKGVGVLIRAAREVQGEFVICGDGRQTDSLRRLARRLGVQDRVRFTGWLPAAELARELASAAVVVLPSVWPEPFGIVGIEAHAAGRPVIASETGGVGDWLEHGVSGLMVPPGDARALARALAELLEDPARQRELGSAGARSVSARFSAARHLAVLREAYARARATWQSRIGNGAVELAAAAPRAAVG
jgi:glycosyltransferase involved in cell wall biosynthesis